MIELDPASTVAGAMERVFLAETTTPDLPGYDADESLKAMRFMRQVIENRLNSHNPIYGAPVGARTEIDVIKVGSQFRGFGEYPTLPKAISGLVDECLRIANAQNDRRSGAYAGFVQHALLAATETMPPPDAGIPPNIVGWRTRGAASPGANYIFAARLQGNDFYTVLKLEPPAAPRPHPQRRHPR